VARGRRPCGEAMVDSVRFNNMKTIAITIDAATLVRIDRLAANRDQPINRSRIIREAVAEYLMRAERRSEESKEKEIFRKNRTKLAPAGNSTRKETGKTVKRGDIYRTEEKVPERGHRPGFYVYRTDERCAARGYLPKHCMWALNGFFWLLNGEYNG
jgi:predicted transcriptional regulator